MTHSEISTPPIGSKRLRAKIPPLPPLTAAAALPAPTVSQPDPVKNAPPFVFAGELVVWSMPKVNRQLVIAYVPGNDPTNPLNLVSVLVKHNENFLRGMKLNRIRHVEGNRYELEGPCPRRRGKW